MSESKVITQEQLSQLVRAYNSKHSADPKNDEIHGTRRGLIVLRSHVKDVNDISLKKLENVASIIITHESAKASEFEALELDDTSLNSMSLIEGIERAIQAIKDQE